MRCCRGSRGIGFAVAEYLLSEGRKVAVAARRKERWQSLDGAEIIAGDLMQPPLQDALLRAILQKFGTCDYLFNRADFYTAGTVEKFNIDKMAK